MESDICIHICFLVYNHKQQKRGFLKWKSWVKRI